MVSNWPYYAQFTYFSMGNDDGAVFLSIGHQNGQQGPSIKKKNARGGHDTKNTDGGFLEKFVREDLSKKKKK
jgi:hypothetical protein